MLMHLLGLSLGRSTQTMTSTYSHIYDFVYKHAKLYWKSSSLILSFNLYGLLIKTWFSGFTKKCFMTKIKWSGSVTQNEEISYMQAWDLCLPQGTR